MNPRDYWFYGYDDGTWKFTGHAILAFKRQNFDWQLAPAMSPINQKMNFSVEGATETHEGLRRALAGIVKQYPELQGWMLTFDGPPLYLSAVLALPRFSWDSWTFYHGTAEAALASIERLGLCPRSLTGALPAYGGEEKAGRSDVVYLTTQLGMAKFAARDAGRTTKSKPIIMIVRGVRVPSNLLVPDEDSREIDARSSLDRMGSFGVRACLPQDTLTPAYALVQGEWRTI